MMKRLLIILFVFSLFTLGCEKEDICSYHGDSYIYFYKSFGDDSPFDTVLITTQYFYNYSSNTKTTDTVWFKVHMRGYLSPTARPVSFRQLEDTALPPNTLRAEADKNFVPFDDPGICPLMVIPADSTWANIPVVILPNQETFTGPERTMYLDFELATNDYFTATRYRYLGRVVINK